ncbi:C40 family peptidase [Clostridium pasteurianum]|uniref:NlpC/P60 domain-containing protein n=1 Tax=Clostridium pasteurianum BC1 TaxID=86416 RepID=R4K406_CLOPA|nr:C40 family peptidase [Clostridium pasteurianum]AGK95269.1 hypothetical protein Clopa_0202 [Clostridium pasteurianum BC1]
MHKRIICIVMAVGVVLGISTKAFADPSLSDQLSSSQAQYNQSQAALNASQAKFNDLVNKIQALDVQMQENMTQAEQIKGKIDKVEGNITQEKKNLEAAQQRVKEEQDLYKSRLRAMYIMGNDGYLSALLDSKGFGDFITKIDNISKVAQFDNNLIASLNERQQEVQNKENSLETSKKELVSLQAESSKNLANLGKQKADQEPLVAQYKVEIASATTASANAKAQVDAVNGKITAQKNAEAAAAAQAAEAAKAVAAAKAAASSAVASATTSTADVTVSINRGTPVTPKPAPKPPAPNPAVSGSIVGYAEQFLNVPYVWGGTSPSGFDCSGFVQYVYSHFGVSIPRTSEDQFGYGTPVSQSQLQVGDLVFFEPDSNGLPGHVGMYIGGGDIIQAPHTGDVVKITPLAYMGSYMGARRVR